VEEIERIHERLENIKAIEPILSALRTIAGATWRAALKRRGGLEEYASQLKEVLTIIAPYLPPSDRPEDERAKHDGNEAPNAASVEASTERYWRQPRTSSPGSRPKGAPCTC